MPFELEATPLEGVMVLKRRVFEDGRGSFSRLFDADDFGGFGWTEPVAQVNHSITARRGSIRGMHYQLPPYADAKLVTCIRGAVFDVALDVRAGSSTLLKTHTVKLSAANRQAMLIPPGCAHGFQALSDDAELIYCHSKAYATGSEAAHNPFDPIFSIDWPLLVTDMSDRDRSHAMLTSSFKGVTF